jgi:hypothetical protein
VLLSQYAITGEHKSLSLTNESLFFTDIETLDLLVD